jgi:DNA-binding response OmpR family regulator
MVGERGRNAGTLWYESRMKDARVLVVDDDPDIRSLLRVLLERAGHEVVDASDGKGALRVVFDARPDLVVLDVTMPELDGWQTLERIRDVSDLPVMVLTAAASELEKVRALGAGADDYVVKPFGRQELVARVQALLRRAHSGARAAPDTYADAFLSIDFGQHAVAVGEREVALTPLEFRLLAAFVRHPRQVLSREQLLELVWGDAYGVGGDQVKLYVGYLRRKLDPEGSQRVPIETVRGFGYRYRPPPE